MTYFDYPDQAGWLDHYVNGIFGGYYLAFTKQFLDENLPPHSTSTDSLQIELVLRRDHSIVHLDDLCPVYELREVVVRDEDYNYQNAWTLQNYFYTEHYCLCHRVSGAKRHGYVPQEEDYVLNCPKELCGEILFDVKKIYYKQRPELILYSETLGIEQLNIEIEDIKCHT